MFEMQTWLSNTALGKVDQHFDHIPIQKAYSTFHPSVHFRCHKGPLCLFHRNKSYRSHSAQRKLFKLSGTYCKVMLLEEQENMLIIVLKKNYSNSQKHFTKIFQITNSHATNLHPTTLNLSPYSRLMIKFWIHEKILSMGFMQFAILSKCMTSLVSSLPSHSISPPSCLSPSQQIQIIMHHLLLFKSPKFIFSMHLVMVYALP